MRIRLLSKFEYIDPQFSSQTIVCLRFSPTYQPEGKPFEITLDKATADKYEVNEYYDLEIKGKQ